MRILILGGGAVGALLAQRLIREKNEVIIVDKDSERCMELEETLDAQIIQGNASNIQTLKKAGVADADILIAVTNSDEANILACLIAGTQSNVGIKLVRLRTHEIDEWKLIFSSQQLNIDLAIHPDRETSEKILRVLNMPGVSERFEFADGKVQLIGMNIESNSWVVGKTMAELDQSSPPKNSLMAILFRSQRSVIPQRDVQLQAGDHVYIAVPTEEMSELFDFMQLPPVQPVKRVFIIGGKQMGIEIALRLESQGVNVKLFEKDLHRCEKIAGLVKSTVVVHADGTDQRTLIEENIEGIDAYLSLTGDDEDNIISSLLSKRLGARKAVALVNRLDFLPMAQLLGINSTVSSRLAVVDRIMQFVRKGKVLSVTTFHEDEEVEAIELLATPGSKFLGKKLKDVHLPRGVIVGAIVRPSGEVIVPRGNAIILEEDRVVFFCLEQLVPELESAFFAGTQRAKM
jgi:trk system potassium uptake protein TrkA